MAKNPFAKGKGTKAAFERSKFDNDKGVKEGGKADMARDKKQMPSFLASRKGKK
jgi:hypothetical protein